MRNIATWVLTVLLALAFFGAGAMKLSSQPMMMHTFALFGLPPWFLYLTGSLEVIAAVLVLIPRTAYLGAGVVVCIMVGALFFHLSHGQAGMIGAPLVLLIIALAVGTLRGWGRVSAPALRRAA